MSAALWKVKFSSKNIARIKPQVHMEVLPAVLIWRIHRPRERRELVERLPI